MRVNGIIAEYNPFHNGHKYHLEASRLRTGADYTIIAMSGNFMQRGTPAILNKYARTEMALRNGADLVLEIPVFYACGSAEYFANGAVSMLDRLGVVDHLCFGSECGQEQIMKQIARILVEEPDSYREKLSEKLKKGCSFPTARSLALLEYCPSLNDAVDIFTSPNNILGIEYIKALLRRHSSIEPVTVKRAGCAYHEKRMGAEHPSALALRQAVLSGQETDSLRAQMPDSAHDILKKAWEKSQPMESSDFSGPLLYKLLSGEAEGYSRYMDVSNELSDRILHHLYQYHDPDSFCELLKTKDTTYSRLSRCMMHILLNITKEAMAQYKAMDYVPYARVLGLRKDAAPLLSAIKKHTDIPMLSKLADADKLLDPSALSMLKADILASHIYNGAEAAKCGGRIRNEYQTPIVVL